MNPLTNVLIKIFVKGFFRAHSGIFLFLFVGLITYCFYIEVLNKTHLPTSDITSNHLIIVLSIIASPIMLSLVGLLWVAYIIKTWQYIRLELGLPRNQFLKYSTNALPRIVQVKSWLIGHLLLSTPMIIYACFAFAVGLAFGHYWIPVILLVFTLSVACISAFVQVARVNSLKSENLSLFIIGQKWPKPFWTLYLLRVLNEQPIRLLVTKFLSFCILAASGFLLAPQENDITTGSIITLTMVVSHLFLIYDSFSFEKSFLSFALNLPHSKVKVYFDWVLCYSVLTIPELLWIVYNFSLNTSVLLLVLHLVTATLYKNLLYKFSTSVKTYLKIVVFTFLLFFLCILMKLILHIIVLNLLLSILLLRRYYYKQNELAIQ